MLVRKDIVRDEVRTSVLDSCHLSKKSTPTFLQMLGDSGAIFAVDHIPRERLSFDL